MRVLLRRLAACLVLILWAGFAPAQEIEAPDYNAWESRAASGERILQEPSASDATLEALRSQLATWREQFLLAQDTDAARIGTLQAQIDTLGDPPAEGESEPEEIAARRSALNSQMTHLRAPVLRAEEAYTRANAMIAEIDRIIRERKANALLAVGPSPLNPTLWPGALEDLSGSAQGAAQELRDNLVSADYWGEARRNLPTIVLVTALGLMLILRGHRWARAGVTRLRAQTRRGTGVFRFLLSLGQILLPLIGLILLIAAIQISGFVGERWSVMLQHLPHWAATLLLIRWLADQAFNDNDAVAVLPLDADDRRRARRIVNILSVSYVLRDILGVLVELDDYPAETEAVLQFPILLISGYFLFRLGRTRNTAHMAGSREAREALDAGLFRLRLARLLGRTAMILGAIGPVLAALGYLRVGEALIYPAIATLGLIGLVMVLQQFINNLYELATGRHPDDDNSLLPVLAGFLLALGSMPFLALIWGARRADLTEIWTRFREGFAFGETRISPSDFMLVIVVFVIGYMLTRLFQGALRTAVLPRTRLDQGGQNAIVSGVGYIGIFAAAVIAITAAGLDLSSLAIVAGALSVGIGFGLQTIVSNFVSGIILLIERPIGEGDWIEVNGTHGIVKDISVRSTRLETFDRYDLIIPNADFVSGTVANYTRGNSLGRLILEVGVAYGSDTRKVEKILMDIARHHEMVLMNPAPMVVFKGFGADSLDFDVRVILRDVGQGLVVRTEMNHQIAERFVAEGIEIPFAQRDIWLRNPEALGGGGGGAAQPPEPRSATGPSGPQTATTPQRQERPEPGSYGAEADADGGDGR